MDTMKVKGVVVKPSNAEASSEDAGANEASGLCAKEKVSKCYSESQIPLRKFKNEKLARVELWSGPELLHKVGLGEAFSHPKTRHLHS